MDVNIGTGPDSWGVWFGQDERQIPWQRFLDEAAAAGYVWTELGPYGYLPTDLATLREELSRRNLKVSGSFAMASLEDPAAWPDLEQQICGAGELLAGLEASFLVLIDGTYSDLFSGESIAPRVLDDDAWRRLIDTTHRVADLVRDRFGLQLVFHPHAATRTPSDCQQGMYSIERG